MIARGVRNVIYNYTDAQRKVRSATSNDAWGPSPALMHEIADLTDNVVAYAEIMPIIWKRLNDHGKNWRHVYKSLVLLDHLIKYGNERVSQQCKENIFAIQTLKDFQYIEDQKDQGYNVREKAKQLVALLKDDERLRNERRKVQEARERFSRQAMGMDSNGAVTYGRPPASSVRRSSIESDDRFGGTSHTTNPSSYRSSSFNENLHSATSKDFVQPTNQEEEQLQMQIALAESQREAEDEERRRRNDELKLKIALERSVSETSPDPQNSLGFDFTTNSRQLNSTSFDTSSHNDPFSTKNTRPSTHLGFTTETNDPWLSDTSGRNSAITSSAPNDPWQAITTSSIPQANPWNGNNHTTISNGNDPWGMNTNNSHTTSPPMAQTKSIDNELSEILAASATISNSTHFQQTTSSNPWDIPSSNSNRNDTNSISPINNNSSSTGTLLYPTIAGTNNTNSNNPSPLPSTSLTSRKTPESFLGENFINLVDLDKLVTHPKSTNPFGSTAPRAQNPFANTNKPPTLDQLTSSNNIGFTTGSTLPPPLIPSTFNATTSSTKSNNPFM